MAIEKNYFAGSGNKRAQASWSNNMYYPEKQWFEYFILP